MKKRNKNGFSLIELIIVLGLLSILSVLMASFVSQSLKNYRLKNQSIKMEEKAATVMREFEQNTRAAKQLVSVSSNELVYYRFFDSESTSPDQIHYFIEGTSFKVGITEPVGVEPNVTYPAANEVIDLIVEDVINADEIFKYYNGGGEEVTSFTDLTPITEVELTIELDKNTSKPPAMVTDITRVMLRNSKRNL